MLYQSFYCAYFSEEGKLSRLPRKGERGRDKGFLSSSPSPPAPLEVVRYVVMGKEGVQASERAPLSFRNPLPSFSSKLDVFRRRP